MTQSKQERILNLDLDCYLKEYTQRNRNGKVFVLVSKDMDHPSVVLSSEIDENTELLSKMDSIFADRHSPQENTIFDIKERTVVYSFSIPDLLKILGRNPSVNHAGRIQDLFKEPNQERIDG